jgi:hypothetical protein
MQLSNPFLNPSHLLPLPLFLPLQVRLCSSSWQVKDALQVLTKVNPSVLLEKCLPYNPVVGSSKGLCTGRCSERDIMLTDGKFQYQQLSEVWDIQRHIRDHGAVITRIDIYDDFEPFFKQSPKGVYPGHRPNATFRFAHAIVLVGYDNNKEFFIAQNSWGTKFADGGFFRIAFGANVAIGNPTDTYGLQWVANPRPMGRPGALQSPLQLLKTSDGSRCWQYISRAGDYVSRVAANFGVYIPQLLQDNSDKVLALDAVLPIGTRLKLCNAKSPQLSAPAGTEGWPTLEWRSGAVRFFVLAQTLRPDDNSVAVADAFCWSKGGV